MGRREAPIRPKAARLQRGRDRRADLRRAGGGAGGFCCGGRLPLGLHLTLDDRSQPVGLDAALADRVRDAPWTYSKPRAIKSDRSGVSWAR